MFNHRPLAHNLSTNPTDDLPKYSSGGYCSLPLPRSMHWQWDLFCPDSPLWLPEFNPPFYELNPDTHRPFANILRMRSAKIKNFRNMQARRWWWGRGARDRAGQGLACYILDRLSLTC